MVTWHKSVEFVANVAIILVAILLGAILVNRYLLHPSSKEPSPLAQRETVQIKPGTKVSLPGMEWSNSRHSLLMVLSTNCRYCTESAPFYQRLAAEKAQHRDLNLVAVLPQNVEESEKYLSEHGINVNDIRRATLASLGVRGTPTLMLVDSTGSVINSWIGKLPATAETEVINAVRQCALPQTS